MSRSPSLWFGLFVKWCPTASSIFLDESDEMIHDDRSVCRDSLMRTRGGTFKLSLRLTFRGRRTKMEECQMITRVTTPATRQTNGLPIESVRALNLTNHPLVRSGEGPHKEINYPVDQRAKISEQSRRCKTERRMQFTFRFAKGCFPTSTAEHAWIHLSDGCVETFRPRLSVEEKISREKRRFSPLKTKENPRAEGSEPVWEIL